MSKSKSRSRRKKRRTSAYARNAGGGKSVRLKTYGEMTLAEKCHTLAEIAQHPLTIDFDQDGCYDVQSTHRKIPQNYLKAFDVTEQSYVDCEGSKVVHRTVNILFRDRMAALRLHEYLTSKILNQPGAPANANVLR